MYSEDGQEDANTNEMEEETAILTLSGCVNIGAFVPHLPYVIVIVPAKFGAVRVIVTGVAAVVNGASYAVNCPAPMFNPSVTSLGGAPVTYMVTVAVEPVTMTLGHAGMTVHAYGTTTVVDIGAGMTYWLAPVSVNVKLNVVMPAVAGAQKAAVCGVIDPCAKYSSFGTIVPPPLREMIILTPPFTEAEEGTIEKG